MLSVVGPSMQVIVNEILLLVLVKAVPLVAVPCDPEALPDTDQVVAVA